MTRTLSLSEAELQKAILETAKRLGWHRAHFRTARMASGHFVTPQQGEVGFPDLVLMRPPRLIFAELKGARGVLSDEQGVWLNGLRACGVETFLWKPVDWVAGRIEEALG